MYRTALRTALLLNCLLLAGCAPGLGTGLTVTQIPAPQSIPREDRAGLPRIIVRAFEDQRPETAVADINGRKVAPEGDVGNAVRAAMEQYLMEAGFFPGAGSGSSLSGVVQEWKVEVSPDFPASHLESRASIRVDCYRPDGTVSFTGTYGGEFSMTQPALTERVIAEGLGKSMAAAIEEAVKDARLRSALVTD